MHIRPGVYPKKIPFACTGLVNSCSWFLAGLHDILHGRVAIAECLAAGSEVGGNASLVYTGTLAADHPDR